MSVVNGIGYDFGLVEDIYPVKSWLIAGDPCLIVLPLIVFLFPVKVYEHGIGRHEYGVRRDGDGDEDGVKYPCLIGNRAVFMDSISYCFCGNGIAVRLSVPDNKA